MKKTALLLVFALNNLLVSAQTFEDGTEFFCANYTDQGSCYVTENDVAQLTAGYNIQSVVYNTTEKALEITSEDIVLAEGALPVFFAWYYHNGTDCDYISNAALPRGGIGLNTVTMIRMEMKCSEPVCLVNVYLGSMSANSMTPTSSTYDNGTGDEDTSAVITFTITDEYVYYDKRLDELESDPGWMNWVEKEDINIYGIDVVTPDVKVYIKGIAIAPPGVRGQAGSDPFYCYTGAVSSQASEKVINVFPNPSSETITLKMLENIPVTGMNLIDNKGRIVRSESQLPSNGKIEVSDLPQGLYLLQVYSNEKLYTQTVIIQ